MAKEMSLERYGSQVVSWVLDGLMHARAAAS